VGRRHGSDDVNQLRLRLPDEVFAGVKVADPAMLKAISAGKKKKNRVDAQKISDLLR
jgi:hypothetical protein